MTIESSPPMTETAYDEVAYPSGIFLPTHPDGLATLARIHGLNPPSIETARVLEIGGGDATNLLALAAAYPKAHFVSFDLAASAVERGQEVGKQAGLTNIRIEVGDILDWANQCADEYDYIIAHGVYAWVPEIVREGIWQLIGRALSPNGVAFVSYNALPGGYIRLALRDMMLNDCAHITDPRARIDKARQVLQDFTAREVPEDPFSRALHDEAIKMLQRRPEVLYHDELGPYFAPQSLTQVVTAAEAHGLSYLTDAAQGLLNDGFIDLSGLDTIASPARLAQVRDFLTIRYFRSSLFVHNNHDIHRQLKAESIGTLHVSAPCQKASDGSFVIDGSNFAITEPRLAAIIEQLIAQFPNRCLVSDLSDDPDIWINMFRLFDIGLLRLYSSPLPYKTAISARPVASPLIRAQLAEGLDRVCTLDHAISAFDTPEPRDLVLLLDGSRDLKALDAQWRALGHDRLAPFQAVIEKLAQSGFLIA